MKKLPFALILFFVGCASLPLPHLVSNGSFTAYVPFGFFSHVDDKGAINIGMPETTNGVSIQKLAGAEEFQQQVEKDLALTRRVYPKEWITESKISELGHLKGVGYKVVVNQRPADKDLGDESYMFLVEADGWWLISAVSLSGDKASWRSILESLRTKKE